MLQPRTLLLCNCCCTFYCVMLSEMWGKYLPCSIMETQIIGKKCHVSPHRTRKECCASNKSPLLTPPPSFFFIYLIFKVRKGRCLLMVKCLQKGIIFTFIVYMASIKTILQFTSRLLLRQNAVVQSKANTELGLHAKYLLILDERY